MPGRRSQEGSRVSRLAIVSETSSPSNARVPVSISYRTHPKAQMSLRLSAGLPFACSGAMYAAVPRITPTPVNIAGEVNVGKLASGPAPTQIPYHHPPVPSRARSPGP